ncbi:MAG: hypothetical protein ACK4M3_03175 [Pyrobaculum sp.]
MKKREEKRGPTLFDFIEKPKEKPTPKDFSEELGEYIKTRGRVTKEEAARWAKEGGISTADFIRAVDKLAREKKIRRRLSDDGELLYEWVG